AGSLPESPTISSDWRGPRAGTCSYLAASVMRCARAGGSPAANRATGRSLGSPAAAPWGGPGPIDWRGGGRPAAGGGWAVGGVSVVKAARRTGRITVQMSEWFARSAREAVDWSKLSGAVRGASLAEPAVLVRAARESVKVEKTRELVRVVGDIGRVQAKAGTQAAIDGLKIAQGPRDISRVARLAETKGTRTRAILKTLGRSAIFLTASATTLFSWLFTAVMMVFGFCAAV